MASGDPSQPLPGSHLAAASTLMLVAAVLRFHDLGGLGFWGAEDYVVLSARGILAHGAPELPSGLLYPRALPYSYATAAVVAVLGESPSSVRLLGALLSTLSVGVVYLLAYRTFGGAVALLAGLVVALSDWDITMARTARMYGPLSFSALVALWCLYEATFRRDARFRIPCLLAIVMTGLLHRTALLLMLPFATLLLFPRRDVGPRGFVLLSIASLVVSSLLAIVVEWGPFAEKQRLVLELHGGELAAPAPVGFEATDGGTLQADPRPVGGRALLERTPSRWLAAGLVALAVSIAARLVVGPGSWLPPATLLAGAALAFQHGMTALYVLAGFLAVFVLRPGLVRRGELLALGALIAAGCGAWVVVGVAIDDLSGREALRELARYPRNFLLLYLLRSPAMFLVACLAGLEILRSYLETRRSPGRVVVLAALVLPAAVMGLHPDAPARFYERYAFFLNPYFVLIYAWGVWWLSGRGAARFRPDGSLRLRVALAAMLLLVTGGIHPSTSLAAATMHHGTNPRLRDARGRPWVFADHAGPARFVCERVSKRDRVVVTDVLGHYVYCPRVDHQFTAKPRNVDAETWIGSARNLTSMSDLLAVLEAAKTEGGRTWLVITHDELLQQEEEGRLGELEGLLAADCVRREYLARDGVSAVYAWDGSCLEAIKASLLAES